MNLDCEDLGSGCIACGSKASVEESFVHAECAACSPADLCDKGEMPLVRVKCLDE